MKNNFIHRYWQLSVVIALMAVSSASACGFRPLMTRRSPRQGLLRSVFLDENHAGLPSGTHKSMSVERGASGNDHASLAIAPSPLFLHVLSAALIALPSDNSAPAFEIATAVLGRSPPAIA